MNRRQQKAAMRDGDLKALKRGLRQAKQDARTARTAGDRQWAEIAAGEYQAELNRRGTRRT